MGNSQPLKGEGLGEGEKWDFLYYQVISYGCCLTDDPVPVPEGLEPIVAIRIISLDCSPLFHRFLDSPFQTLCRRVRYLFQPDPSCDFPILSKSVVFILLFQSLTKPLPVKKQSLWGPEEA